MKNDNQGQYKSFLITINNPEEKGLTHDAIKNIINDKFKHVLYYCLADEIGNEGTYHTHIYITMSMKKRFQSVINAFKKNAHIDVARGTAQECVEYVGKTGKWKESEKGTTSVEGTFEEYGNIPDENMPNANNKTDMLENINRMLLEGLTPNEILSKHIAYRVYENVIKSQYFMLKSEGIPPIRDVSVNWHIGKTGSGKSYIYVKLCEEHGEDNVYLGSDYTNRCSALFDNYTGQEIIILDEVKPNSFDYGYLLKLLDKYKIDIHARYKNVRSIWSEVHITSVYSPDEIYEAMIQGGNKKVDTLTQLLRRITTYVYHWKDKSGYHEFRLPADEYKGKYDLEERATKSKNEFKPVKESDNVPFDTGYEQGKLEV